MHNEVQEIMFKPFSDNFVHRKLNNSKLFYKNNCELFNRILLTKNVGEKNKLLGTETLSLLCP